MRVVNVTPDLAEAASQSAAQGRAAALTSALQTLRARLESFHDVPREQQPLVASALEYLKTRDESWRLRREALRKSNLQILSEADSVERMSLDRFRKLKVAASAS